MLTAGSVKTISCLSAVETRRFVFSLFRAIAVMSWPFANFRVWKTYQKKNFSGEDCTKDNREGESKFLMLTLSLCRSTKHIEGT